MRHLDTICKSYKLKGQSFFGKSFFVSSTYVHIDFEDVQSGPVELRIFNQCFLESSTTLESSSMLKNEPILKPQITLWNPFIHYLPVHRESLEIVKVFLHLDEEQERNHIQNSSSMELTPKGPRSFFCKKHTLKTTISIAENKYI